MKTISSVRALARIVFLLYGFSASTFAAVAIIDDGSSFSTTNGSSAFERGYLFTLASNDLSVTSLGVWDDGSDGLVISHDVGLWDSSGAFIASVTVPAGTTATLLNEFRYIELSTPITLTNSGTYTIAATYPENSPDNFRNTDPPGPTFSSDIASASSRYAGTAGLAFPTNSIGGSPYVGPNFQYVVVPEPASGSLLLLGAVLCLGRRMLCTSERNG